MIKLSAGLRRRQRSVIVNLGNIYLMWTGILIVFVLHTLVAISEETRIRRENVDAVKKAELKTYKHVDHRTLLTDSNKHRNTAKRNISKIEDTVVGNVSDKGLINASTHLVESKLKDRGSFGKQIELEKDLVDPYKNQPRPSSCDHCFPTNFTFDSASICNTSGPLDKVDIIILIPTAYTHIRQRMALRTTWLLRTKKNTAKVRYAFIMGQTNIKQMQQATLKEKRKYKDIVIANFTDSYMNLTLKTLAAFHWVMNWCPQVRVVVKADDDVFMNLDNLIIFSGKNLNQMRNSLFGGCWARQPIRRLESKYYVSNTTYSNGTFPEVCSGTTYLTSSKVIGDILRISPDVPFFYLEDVYVAFCMEKLGIKARKNTGILTKNIKSDVPLCVYKGPQVISAHVKNPRKIEQIWRTECDKKKPGVR